MEDLIKALQILLKYGNPKYPTSCSHEELNIVGIDPSDISKEDVLELDRLGFHIQVEGEYDDENECDFDESCIYSFKYGSC